MGKVDDLVKALGADTGICKSEDESPCVFLDGTYCKARIGGGKGGKGWRVVSQAVVITTGVSADGRPEVPAFAVGDSGDGAFWTGFLRSSKARGLAVTQLVISDAPTGLKQAIAAVMIGGAWQRCPGPFLRNVLSQVPKGSQEMVAAAVLIETHDEGQVCDRRYLSENSMAQMGAATCSLESRATAVPELMAS